MKRARPPRRRDTRGVSEDDALRLSDGRKVGEADVVWLPPVESGTVFALGLNYADHAKELSFKAPETPLVFLKGRSALVGHRAQTRRPAGVTFMHYECELAVVIGAPARCVPRNRAYEVVAGYTVANDYAVRDYLENYYRPNLRVKSRDACTPIGPWLVDAADVPDPMKLNLRTTVNGKVTQRGQHARHGVRHPFSGRISERHDDAGAGGRDPHRDPGGPGGREARRRSRDRDRGHRPPR